MIQEIGEHVFRNEYVVCEPSARDYVLHYRDRGCLVCVVAHGKDAADAWAMGNEFCLPRVADFEQAPERLVYAFAIDDARFFLALDDEVAEPEGFTYEASNWLR